MSKYVKIQYINRKIEENEWTEGRWSRPIEDTYKNIINKSYDIIAFPITQYKKPTRNFKKIKCKICKRYFKPANNKHKMCGFCFQINICYLCGKIYITQHKNNNNDDNKNDKTFCSHNCSRAYACLCMDSWYKDHPEQRSKNMELIHKKYDSIKYCDICKENTIHLIGIGCLNCHNKSDSKREFSKINMTKLWENKEFRDLAYNYSYCKDCNDVTLHKFFTCLKCNPEAKGSMYYKFCNECQKETLHVGEFCINCNPEKFNFIHKNKQRIYIKFCSCCNKETPHKYNVETREFYCQVCDGEKVWCEKHEQFETIKYNSDPSHGLFYKSVTTKWIKNFPEEFNYIQSIIDFNNNINNSKPICGIYLWRIDNIPYYGGKSYDILSRSYDHIYEMQNDPEYWLNINDPEINSKHTISIEVLQECDKNISDDELHNIELEWIAKIKPISQKCNGTDHIIPLNQRDYNIYNLKEKYEEKLINFKEERRENKI